MSRIMCSTLLSLLIAGTTSSFQGQPSKCGSPKVQYQSFDAQYANKFVVQSIPASQLPSQIGEKEFSEQRTMWLVTVAPDTTKPVPWSTVVYVGSDNGAEVLKLEFLDHSDGPEPKWLNEKLLFGRVWWGRIASTDFIFDIQKRDFVYREMAHYGEFIQACRE